MGGGEGMEVGGGEGVEVGGGEGGRWLRDTSLIPRCSVNLEMHSTLERRDNFISFGGRIKPSVLGVCLLQAIISHYCGQECIS